MKQLFTKGISLILFSFLGTITFGQINVTGGQTAQQLAEFLAGPNITVTNAVLSEGNTALGASASSNAAGEFTGVNSDIGFDSGVILSSGNINEAPGPNGATNTGANLGNSGTAQMTTLAGATTYDAITLEFDFEVQSTLIQFNYVFASEEYPEYAPPNNSSFNDVFAFFISGPGITGEENIALIPSTTNPVSINNVNAVTNSQYYNDNVGGQDIEFDGYTTIFEASRTNLTPCQVYHLKLVISDAGDGVYSSAVFLQENSLIQGVVDVQTQTINSDDIALEGCIPASFTFSFDDVSNQDRIINFIIEGTAVNGVDYQYVDSSMTIVAGDTSATIYIDAFSDGITEGQESVYIIYQPAPCAPYDTAFLYINDAQPIDFTLDGYDLDCYNDFSGEIQVNATGGFPPYSYEVTYPNQTVSTTQNNPITGLSAGTYSVAVYDSYGCEAQALVVGGVYDADTTFLPDVPNGQVTTYDAPLAISGFNTGQVINNVSQIQQICATMEHSYLGDLQITVEAPSGEIVILKQQNGGGSCDLGEPFASGPVDGQNSNLTDPGVGYEYCFNASPVFGTMVNESNNYTHTIPASTGGTYTDNYLPAGSYTPFESFNNLVGADMNGTWTMHVTDQYALDNGYIFNWYISLIGDMPDTLVTLTQPAEIAVTGFATNSTCGGSDGSINIDIQDAVQPYTVLWSNGATTEDLTGISAGTYTVTVTDANGCQSQQTFLVNNIGSLSITSNTVDASCYGGNDGSIDITPAGGQSPYTFSWDSGQTSEDISGLTAGNYTVTMQDQMGCIISEVVTVGEASQVVITAVSVQNEECNTDNGSIDISLSGGSGSYGYQWSNGSTTQDISSLTSGTYTVNVVDGNGCTATASYTLVNDVSNCSAYCFIAVEANVINDEMCGSANGSIDINVLNGVAPLSYSWSNGAVTEDISGLSAGSYTVVVTDANNCSDVMTFTVNNNTGSLAVSGASVSSENCGNGNGSIDITVTGGAMPYTYSWSNGATSEDITSLTEGTYDVTVTDGNGCMATASYIVTNNAGSLSATATVTDELCTSQNGAVNQTVTGGNGTLTYSWSSGQTTQDISGLTAGNYDCTITDQTGCSIIESYTVGQTSGNITLAGSNITNEVCGNGQGAINITVTGSGLIYNWSNGATTEDVSGLSAGNYYCVITNAQGCSYTTPTFSVINASGTLNVTTQLVTDEICGNANGSININVTGGSQPYIFNWSNGSTNEDLVGLTAGTYTVTVSDMNGCTESHSITVNGNSGTLNIQNAVITDEVCGNGAGAIDVIVQGGSAPLSYSWSSGQSIEDISGLSAGQYSITITDQNGCTVSDAYNVNNNANGLAFSSAVTNEICSNGQGQIDLTVSGGNAPYTYNWSNGGTTASISGLSAGTYSCTITDNSGCSIVTGTISVGNTASGMSASTVVVDASCGNNGSIDLTVTGGTGPMTYNWSTGATTEDIANLTQGTYTYTVTDANSCQLSGTADVIETNGNITYTYTTSSEICNNASGSIDLTPAGGQGPYTYSWSNGPATEDQTGLSAGTYTCTITDQNLCSVTTTSIQINNLSGSLSISNVLVTDETCSNGLGNVDISITGGQAPITYAWSTGATTEDISNLSSGTYTVTVTDGNGCQASTQAVVNSSSGSLAITQPIVVNESCSNGQGSIDISVAGAANPITYLWSNGAASQDISNLSAGTYSVTVTDGNGCSATGSYTVINSGTNLSISSANITDEFCGSGSGSITVNTAGGSSPFNYQWSNGGNTATITNLSAGTYTITVTDGGGCQATGSYTVNNNASNLSVSGVVADENCGDGMGEIQIATTGGNAPISYTWNSGQTTEDITGLSAGTYNLVVEDNYGCTANYSGTVNNITNGLSVSITSVVDEVCGQSDGSIDATITGTGIVSTVWSSGQTTEDISGIPAGTYTLTVTNNVGCVATATTAVLNQTTGLSITFENVGDENCMNGQGFVDIEVGGTGPFTYNWSDGQTTQDAIGLSAGTYDVTITDGLGCIMTASYQVNNSNSTNITASSVTMDATCTTADGAIDITVSGGIGPFTYVWDSGQTTEDISNVTAGTYEVTITDAASCSVTQTVTVQSQSSGLGFTALNIQDEFCGQQNGSITFFTGGTADDYYLDGVNLGGWFAGNLSAGTYTVAITDNFGCYADSVVSVGANAPFSLSSNVTDESCNQSDGAVDITVSGGSGYTYQWDSGQTTEDISGVPAGTYTVTVTNTNGCSVEETVTVGGYTTFDISATVAVDSCGQGVGAIDQTIVSGSGLTFSWSTGATTEDVSGLVAGTYQCTVTDPAVGGCVETFTYSVGSTTNGMTASAVVSDETCNAGNGAIDLTVSGGVGPFTYSWDSGSSTEDISGLSAGQYIVTYTDQNDGCVAIDTITVNNVNTIFAGSGMVTDASGATSADGAIDVTLSTATTYTYSWNSGQNTEDISGLNPGTYSITVTSAEGCDTTMTFVVNDQSLSILENVIENIALAVYPNPANGLFYVNYTLPAGITGHIEILDAVGRVVRRLDVEGSEELSVDAVDYAAGMYVVRLKTGNITQMKRVVLSNY